MSCVVLQSADGIATLTLDRPDKLNALGLEGDGDDFVRVCDEINHDDTVRCVILTGAGRAFSAGGDIKAMLERSGNFGGEPHELADNYRQGIHRIIRALRGIKVPVIAAVNGHAVGLGNDLLTTADIRIAAQDAKFAASFINLGLVPGDGGAWLLPRAIGAQNAAQLLFTGDSIDAETALAMGLVARVVPADQLHDAVNALAKTIASKPPLALRMTKQLLRQAERADLETVQDAAAGMQAMLHGTKDHRLALEAVLNRETAQFTGQ